MRTTPTIPTNNKINNIKKIGNDNARAVLAAAKAADKKARMTEAMEKRRREADERRGALGRQLDSERRKHQAENAK